MEASFSFVINMYILHILRVLGVAWEFGGVWLGYKGCVGGKGDIHMPCLSCSVVNSDRRISRA